MGVIDLHDPGAGLADWTAATQVGVTRNLAPTGVASGVWDEEGAPMRRRMMKSKIHRATVTDADLHYVGSITVDADLMEAADLIEYEQVAVVDIDNGSRLETYVITGEPGSGSICLNGAAARLVSPGDRVIIISYGEYDEAELADYAPTIVHVDTANRVVPEAQARRLAVGANPRRYVEVAAG